jgi:hypothetical protein
MLPHLRELATNPLLIGTWADAKWAIEFYEKNGFELLSPERKHHLIPKYWKISRRQAETSVVLARSGSGPIHVAARTPGTMSAAERIQQWR